MALITIDGVKLEVPEHKCVLECALRAGIYIPICATTRTCRKTGPAASAW